MTAPELLARLDGVRSRGTGKWSARCPAHQDNSPSLSIGEGADRILLHCFALCEKRDIVAALGITMADLFFDAPDRERTRSSPPKLNRVALAFRYELAALDRRLRAERVISGAAELDSALWSNEERDLAMKAVSRAYADQERATLCEGVADNLRAKDFAERHTERTTGHDQHPSAA